MGRVQTKAECRLCQKSYTKSGMTRHLQSCLKAQETEDGEEQKLYLLRVEGKYAPQYWMYLEMPATDTFGVLDTFLRWLWLECCDHLSDFDFGKHRATPFNVGSLWDDEVMAMRLGQILTPKMKFGYTYDFGSSTRLVLQVVGIREGIPRREPVMVLARNEPPPILCDYCGKKDAIELCPVCVWYDKAWVCKGCKKKHEKECGEDVWSPVVNSPRVGICGYEMEPDEEAAMKSVERRKPSAKDREKYEEVEALLRKHMSVKGGRRVALELWEDFVKAEAPKVRSAAAYAASAEYLAKLVTGDDNVSQSALAKKYKTSTASISQKYREMDDTLEVLDGDEGGFFFGPPSMVLSPDQIPAEARQQVQEVMKQMMVQLGMLEGDEGIEVSMDSAQKKKLKSLPLVEETWVGGKRTMSAYVVEPVPVKPEICLWTNTAGHPVLGKDLVLPGEAAQSLFDLLIRTMEEPEFGPPGRRNKLLIANKEYVEPFREKLAPYDIEVKFGGEKLIEAICTLMEAHLNERAPQRTYLSNERVSKELVAALFEASAALYRQAPWDVIGDAWPFHVDLTGWGLGQYSLCIIGAAGLNKGILIFDSLDDFDHFYQVALRADSHSTSPPRFQVGIRSLDFEKLSDISSEHRREAMEHGWEMADTGAYPDFQRIDPEMSVMPLEEDDFVIAIACAWALAAYTERHRKHMQKVARGKSVKPITMTTEVPMLAGRPALQASLPHPMADDG